MSYAELGVTSNFSFLRGGSHPEELIAEAHALGLAAIGIADRNTVVGLVRAHAKAKEEGMRFLPGARLAFADGTPDILAYPRSLSGWSTLTRLLTLGKRRAEKGDCKLLLPDLLAHAGGLNLIAVPARVARKKLVSLIRDVKAAAPVWLAASHLYRGDDARRMARLAAIAREAGAPLIATNDVLYHAAERRPLQDVLTCIREHTTLEKAGRLLAPNAERHLKPESEMLRLFRAYPEGLREAMRFAGQCSFSLDELKPSYPLETRAGFATPMDALIVFAEEGANRRYPGGIPAKIRKNMDHELALVAQLNYAPYFLTVHDIVCFARSQGILCQGRGSAANSTLCYCLGITEVDPLRSDLLFERFISAERNEPPDIDVDFEHERREEVIQYVYRKYSRERAALTATTICYRGRSAIRDVGKVFGLSEDMISRLARTLWGWTSTGVEKKHVERLGFDPEDPTLARALALADELIDFPRHLSQHVGGFVITEGRLDDVVPIENAAMEERTVIEWNKDDIEELGILKVDLLGLGMLSCIRRAFDLMRAHYGFALTLATIPAEEEAVYRMLGRADSVGVFQVESRAQMSMLPRLKPKEFYDLVIEVAIVRPGPIQGDMVHPYLRRRQGIEQVTYPSPSPEHGPADELEQVLKKTLGVPLFQEQAMKVAIVAAGFAPAEADKLRRAMATFRRVGTIQTFRRKFVDNMTRRGYPRAFAEASFHQIEGFGEYGFPESHAASFALLVYASSWLKCHYPDVFAAALLNSQPMGFYAPAQIVRDAQEHGVEVRAADINFSGWDNRLEEARPARAHLHPRHADMKHDLRSAHAVRLGLRQISGFREADTRLIEEVRGKGFVSLRDFWLRTGLEPPVLRRLAEADAFNSLGLNRRQALWARRALRRTPDKDDAPLLSRAQLTDAEPDAALPRMAAGQEVVEDYRHMQLSLKAHPALFLRPQLAQENILRAEELAAIPNGRHVQVAGLVLVRQRPGTSQTIFMTLEDETGASNIIVWPRVYEKFRTVVMSGRFVCVSGTLQCESGVIHVVAEQLTDLTSWLRQLFESDASSAHGTSARIAEAIPEGRNFR
ncbi:MAG: error-prone DNA polymerase [Alphaproteobacteria bacterium]